MYGNSCPTAVPDAELPVIVSAGRRPKRCPTAAPCTGTSACPLPCGSQGLLPPTRAVTGGAAAFSDREKLRLRGGDRECSGRVEAGTAAPGAPCAMTPGAWQRPRWCVSSLAVARPWKPCRLRHSALEMGASGWMRCSAGAGSPPCGTVLRSPGGRATASMRRMLV